MTQCRINLDNTSYKEIDYSVLDSSYYKDVVEIYKQYCDYKKFNSVLPIFVEELENKTCELLGYYHNNKLIAFSMMNLYTSKQSVFSEQFAWNYENPQLKLGYNSIRSECARYKRLGYKYLYIGEYNTYKRELKGFEQVGTLDV